MNFTSKNPRLHSKSIKMGKKPSAYVQPKTGTIFESKSNMLTPAPNAYAKEKYLETGKGGSRQNTIGIKFKPGKQYINPAPNAYPDTGDQKIKVKHSEPKYSIKPKTGQSFIEKEVKYSNKVAPSQYDVKVRPAPTPMTISQRYKAGKEYLTPAPNAYIGSASDALKSTKVDVKFTMKSGRRPIINTKNVAGLPAPNAYNALKPVTKIEKTIGQKFKETNKYQTPAPNAYDCDIKKFDKTVEAAPVYSMATRYSAGDHF